MNNLFCGNSTKKKDIGPLIIIFRHMSLFRKRLARNESVSRSTFQFFYRASLPEGGKKASVGQLGRRLYALRAKLCIFHGGPKRGGSAARKKIEVTTTMSNRLECGVRGCSSTFVNHRTYNFKVLKPLNEIFIPFAHSALRNETIFIIKFLHESKMISKKYEALKSFQIREVIIQSNTNISFIFKLKLFSYFSKLFLIILTF